MTKCDLADYKGQHAIQHSLNKILRAYVKLWRIDSLGLSEYSQRKKKKPKTRMRLWLDKKRTEIEPGRERAFLCMQFSFHVLETFLGSFNVFTKCKPSGS